MSEQGHSDYDYDDEDFAGDYYYSSNECSQGDEPPPSETESEIYAPEPANPSGPPSPEPENIPHPHNSTRRHRAPTNRGPLRTTTTQKNIIHPSRVHPLITSTTTKPKEMTKNSEKPKNGLSETNLVGLLTSVSVIFQTLYYFVALLLIPLFLLHRLPPSQKTAASHRALSA